MPIGPQLPESDSLRCDVAIGSALVYSPHHACVADVMSHLFDEKGGCRAAYVVQLSTRRAPLPTPSPPPAHACPPPPWTRFAVSSSLPHKSIFVGALKSLGILIFKQQYCNDMAYPAHLHLTRMSSYPIDSLGALVMYQHLLQELRLCVPYTSTCSRCDLCETLKTPFRVICSCPPLPGMTLLHHIKANACWNARSCTRFRFATAGQVSTTFCIDSVRAGYTTAFRESPPSFP